VRLHPTPYILHPTPYTLHPAPYTQSRKPLGPSASSCVCPCVRVHVCVSVCMCGVRVQEGGGQTKWSGNRWARHVPCVAILHTGLPLPYSLLATPYSLLPTPYTAHPTTYNLLLHHDCEPQARRHVQRQTPILIYGTGPYHALNPERETLNTRRMADAGGRRR